MLPLEPKQGERLIQSPETTNTGSGAVAQGVGAVAAGERGVAIGGNAPGAIFVTGDGNQIFQGLTTEQVVILFQRLQHEGQPKTWNGRFPYVGLSPFQEDDAEFFFGREKLVTELIERIQHSHFLCVTGPSGSGKSSLVHAGLIPALKQGRLEGSSKWLFISFSPHDNPVEQLAQAMARLVKSPVAAQYVQEHGLTQPDALYKQVETLLSDDRQQRCIIVVDQFEELFTQTKNETQLNAFVNLLTTAATLENTRIIVILTLRADFISPCANYPRLRALLNQPQQFQLVGAMDPEELLQAIVMPVLNVGALVQPALISQIIADMKREPDSLPLMQFALQELFTQAAPQKGQEVTLTLETYIQKGGIYGVLEQHADGVLDRLNEDQLPIARHMFSQLVEIGRDAVVTKRTVSLQELIAANTTIKTIEAVLSHFADSNARLITTGIAQSGYAPTQPKTNDQPLDQTTTNFVGKKLKEAQSWLKKLVRAIRTRLADAWRTKSETNIEPAEPNGSDVKWQNISLAHEKLIDAWSWLKKLVDENREAQLFQQRLDEMRRAWEKNNHDVSGLLRGPQLTEALAWAEKYPYPALAEFLKKSRKHEQQRRWFSVGGRSAFALLLIPGLFFVANAWMFWQRQKSQWQPIASFPSHVVTAAVVANSITSDTIPSQCVGTNHIGVGCTRDGFNWNLYQSGVPTGTPDWFNSRERLWGALLGSEWSGRVRAVYALAFDEQDSSRIYIFLNDEGLYHSDDSGVHWSPLLPKPTLPEFPKTAASKLYADGERLFIASGLRGPSAEEGHLFISADRAESWRQIKGTKPKTGKINDFVVQKPKANADFELTFVAEMGLFRASQESDWNPTSLAPKLGNREFIWIVYDKARDIFYIAAYDDENNQSYLYRWRDGEQQVTSWGAGHAGAIRTLAVNPGERVPGILWLLFERGEVFAVDEKSGLTSYGTRPGWF